MGKKASPRESGVGGGPEMSAGGKERKKKDKKVEPH